MRPKSLLKCKTKPLYSIWNHQYRNIFVRNISHQSDQESQKNEVNEASLLIDQLECDLHGMLQKDPKISKIQTTPISISPAKLTSLIEKPLDKDIFTLLNLKELHEIKYNIDCILLNFIPDKNDNSQILQDNTRLLLTVAGKIWLKYGKYENFILKSMKNLRKVNIISNEYIINWLQQYLLNVKHMEIEDTSLALLSFCDLIKIIGLKDTQSQAIFDRILEKFKESTNLYIDEHMRLDSVPANSSYYLSKILFCFVRLKHQDHRFLNKIICFLEIGGLQHLEEMELTSLLYTLGVMNKKLKIKLNFKEILSTNSTTKSLVATESDLIPKIQPNVLGTLDSDEIYNKIYLNLQESILRCIKLSQFSYKRIPYILYSFVLICIPPSIKIVPLMNSLIKSNLSKFSLTEISTLLYCYYKMPALDPSDQLGLLIFMNRLNDKDSLKILFNADLFIAFMALRRIMQNPKYREKQEFFKDILIKLVDVFIEKFDILDLKTQIRGLYEICYVQKMLDLQVFREKFAPFLMGLEMENMNNHDIITIGYLMKKYFWIDDQAIGFWKNYLNLLSERQYDIDLEIKRAYLIFENIQDLLNRKLKKMEEKNNIRMSLKLRTMLQDVQGKQEIFKKRFELKLSK